MGSWDLISSILGSAFSIDGDEFCVVEVDFDVPGFERSSNSGDLYWGLCVCCVWYVHGARCMCMIMSEFYISWIIQNWSFQVPVWTTKHFLKTRIAQIFVILLLNFCFTFTALLLFKNLFSAVLSPIYQQPTSMRWC